jgi:hypothetical protein
MELPSSWGFMKINHLVQSYLWEHANTKSCEVWDYELDDQGLISTTVMEFAFSSPHSGLLWDPHLTPNLCVKASIPKGKAAKV